MEIPALRQCLSEHEYMPLLRSLAEHAACVAINMALLMELFASPPTRVRGLKDACKERSPLPLWFPGQGRRKKRQRTAGLQKLRQARPRFGVPQSSAAFDFAARPTAETVGASCIAP